MGSGMICPVTLSRPDLTAQQSSTETYQYKHVDGADRSEQLTINIFIPSIFQTEFDDLVGSSQDICLVDITTKRVPGVPSQSWEFTLRTISTV